MDAAYTFLPVGDGEWAGGMLVQPDCYGEDVPSFRSRYQGELETNLREVWSFTITERKLFQPEDDPRKLELREGSLPALVYQAASVQSSI